MITLTLPEIAQKFLDDHDYIERLASLVTTRQKTLPTIQFALNAFIQGKIPFAQLSATLNEKKRPWYSEKATSNFHREIIKFEKYHVASNEEAGEQLRELLQGLNARTVGQTIERCYTFLLQERERLRHADPKSNTPVNPGSSAYIISLFALWLDPTGDIVVCTDHVRKGIHLLVEEGMLPGGPDLKLSTDSIIVQTRAQYEAYLSQFNSIKDAAPQITSLPYWREFFIWWVMNNKQRVIVHLFTPENALTKEVDDFNLLSDTPTQPLRAPAQPDAETPQEQSDNDDKASLLIDPTSLLPVPEPQLTANIREVQRHILVDEHVIRRIYHALLAGHVILTGPPGTGKTELARLIPEILWRQPLSSDQDDIQDEANGAIDDTATEYNPDLSTENAYTTRLVTATDDWSPRTLISGIVPQTKDGQVTYKIQYGHLTSTILKNWSLQGEQPEDWNTLALQRTRVTTSSSLARGIQQTFRGQWLVINEFNRAPIDLALGDALTALGGHDVLRVGTDSGSAELPIPQDFRIIGTLNSFDRNYLNQISEALKRRFSFVEILPPGRQQRAAEQGIVLYKALHKISDLSKEKIIPAEQGITWQPLTIHRETNGRYAITWNETHSAFQEAFETAWRIFEVIRIYRQLGTAQAISLLRHMLIAGILQDYATREQWIEQALDAALCDTIADQLQVLLPDEIETLHLYLTTTPEDFIPVYLNQLSELTSRPQRLYGQLLSLASVQREENVLGLTDAEIEKIARDERPTPPMALLNELFHIRPGSTFSSLPQFTRRLRTFKGERGL